MKAIKILDAAVIQFPDGRTAPQMWFKRSEVEEILRRALNGR